MARLFNGTSGKITFNTVPAQEGNTLLSVSFQLYRHGNGEGGYGVVFESAASGPVARGPGFYNDNGTSGWGLVFFSAHTTGGQWSVAYPTNDQWNVYTMTLDQSSTANDPIIYKNGASVGITERITPSGALKTDQDTLTIGNRSIDDGLTWDGRIAEFGVWNRILTADEAAGLGKGMSPLCFKRGLVFYAPLWGGTAQEVDLMNAAIGTISGSSASKIEHPRVIYPQSSNE